MKREAVAHPKALLGFSERRAWRIVGADRKMVRHEAQRAPDTVLRDRLRELANERRRFGCRRLFVLLRREGEPSGISRIYRLYREEGLTVRKRKARRKAIGTRAQIPVAARPHARWSLDFATRTFGSSMTGLPTVNASGVSTWSTTSPGNASRRSRILRYPDGASHQSYRP